MREAGDPGKVVISIYFRNPYVLDDASGVKSAGALLATFGVSDQAQLDIISGKAKPQGRLPFALPRSVDAVRNQHPMRPAMQKQRMAHSFPLAMGLGIVPTGKNTERSVLDIVDWSVGIVDWMRLKGRMRSAYAKPTLSLSLKPPCAIFQMAFAI